MMYTSAIFFVLVMVPARSQIILEYKPTRPFYHPNAGNYIGQIIPSGKPWPDGPEGYSNFSSTSFGNRNKEVTETTTPPPENSTPPSTHTILEYRPSRPFVDPKPGYNINQNIPSRPENYESSSQVNLEKSNKPVTQRTTTPGGFIWEEEEASTKKPGKPNLEDRIKEPVTTKVETQKPASLDYQPNRPSFHPNPGNTVGQIIPSGQPWPSNPEGYQNFSQTEHAVSLVDKLKDTTTSSSTTSRQTPNSLEYQPTRPPFHPNPGDNLGQIIPPGKPWPDNSEGYQNISQIASAILNLVDRIKEDATTSSVPQKPTPPSLVSKPTRPFHAPNPGVTLSQIISPGKPWPDSPEGYQNFSQTTPPAPGLVDKLKEDEKVVSSSVTQKPTPPSLGYEPTRPFYAPNPGVTPSQIIPPGKPWPDSPEGYQNFSQIASPAPSLVDRVKEDEKPVSSSVTQKPTPPSLEYKPTRPFYAPNPGVTPSQIIPPGKPWPDSPEGYQNFSQIAPPVPGLVDRLKENEKPVSSSSTQKTTPPRLGYEPTRPFYAPNPVTLSQIIPPGKPWPASPEGYQNFSQIASPAPGLVDRLKEDEKPVSPSVTQKTTPPSLAYKPTRPFYAPNPGVTLSQIIPPGKPWPDSAEGYQNFSQIASPAPGLVDRVKEDEKPVSPSVTQEDKLTYFPAYKPTRPFYAPNPGVTPSQIIPPGNPWPYQNVSQLSSPAPNLVDRVKEDEQPSVVQRPTVPSLEYKPTRPFYAPNPGVTVSQIIPPGKPWPDSLQGYQNPNEVPSLGNRGNTGDKPRPSQTETTQAGFIWEEDVLKTSNTPTANRERKEEISTEGQLYTSAPLEKESGDEESRKVDTDGEVEVMPIVLVPVNSVPSYVYLV